ncbi:MAG: HepT-like ribonuclease domain-containing protein [Candidatus Hodarchaeales archaeon]|jgi:uncharacterized protein with HEPN domain
MSNRSPTLFITDIREAIGKVELYIKDLNFTEFKKDDKTVDAVVRNLEIIGEAIKNLSADFKDNYPHVKWRGATAMRDRLIHGYFGVDIEIVWETITTDLKELKEEVEKIWRDIT